jgi:hypothetical protein
VTLMHVRVTEMLASKYRTLAFIGDWPIGIAIMSLWAMLTRHWQWCTLAVNVVGIPAIIFSLLMPESPRWFVVYETRLKHACFCVEVSGCEAN